MLVDEAGTAIGSAPKATVHTATTPLHLAFSCYVFNPAGQLLLTRRAACKPTFPSYWTNSVCGHPGPGESDTDAISRRAWQELGLVVEDPQPALPRFRYRAESNGIVENEICPVYLARTSGQPKPDPLEVDDHTWTDWQDFINQLARTPQRFSPWCHAQAVRLQAHHALPLYAA